MATYLVTGGAGFIGSHLSERLLRDGHRVRVVDNFSTGFRENLYRLQAVPEYNARLEVFERDLRHLESLREVFDGVDVVFHQAALPSVPRSVDNPLDTHHQCATATLHVLMCARDVGVKRVIYAASSSAYGDVEGEYKIEDMPPNPKSPYGVAKLFGEYYCKVFHEVYGLETVSLRYFNVFGPRQDPNSPYAAVIPIFIRQMLQGHPPTVHGDGQQSRDFTYIDNVVHGNLLAAQVPRLDGQVINLATAGQITILDLVAKLNRLLNTHFDPIHLEERRGDIKHSSADITRAGKILGYEPIVDFDTGLARTVEWFKTHHLS